VRQSPSICSFWPEEIEELSGRGREGGQRLLAAGSGSAANKMAARLLASHFGHFCGAIEQFRLCFASCRRLMMMVGGGGVAPGWPGCPGVGGFPNFVLRWHSPPGCSFAPGATWTAASCLWHITNMP